MFRTEYEDAEFFIGNSGTLRTNYVIEKGPFTKLTLMNIFPYSDYIGLVKITGQKVKEALENGVSQYPKFDGRFPLISGFKFSFNPDLPPY